MSDSGSGWGWVISFMGAKALPFNQLTEKPQCHQHNQPRYLAAKLGSWTQTLPINQLTEKPWSGCSLRCFYLCIISGLRSIFLIQMRAQCHQHNQLRYLAVEGLLFSAEGEGRGACFTSVIPKNWEYISKQILALKYKIDLFHKLWMKLSIYKVLLQKNSKKYP